MCTRLLVYVICLIECIMLTRRHTLCVVCVNLLKKTKYVHSHLLYGNPRVEQSELRV